MKNPTLVRPKAKSEAELVKRATARRERDLVTIAFSLLKKGLIDVNTYSVLCSKNNQLMW